MKVLFVASEALPFITTGGMGEVVGALPKALKKLDVEAAVVLPLYEGIPQRFRSQMTFLTRFTVALSWRQQYCGVFRATVDGVEYYLLDNEQYFKRSELYGHFDDGERFAFFSKAALELVKHMTVKPNIIHCNDWQSALTPVYYRTHYANQPEYAGIKFVYTIHNLKYQGKYGWGTLGDVFGIGDEWLGLMEYDGCINLMKGAIETADIFTTVSPTYAREITGDYFGEGLAPLMRQRADKIRGILNGIDVDDYNPSGDPKLFAPYSVDDPSAKSDNKAGLQKMLGLKETPNTPLIAMVTRLADHKGIDLIIPILEELMNQEPMQMVVVGTGDRHYEDYFRAMQSKYPGRLHAAITFNADLAHKVYAGSDIFLMPSQIEPCGLSQMIALRYGTLPIVRETGGLKDSIQNFNEKTGEGNGFSFTNYNAHEMMFTIKQALNLYNKPDIWAALVKKAMACDFSWNRSAGEYLEVYNRLIGGKPKG